MSLQNKSKYKIEQNLTSAGEIDQRSQIGERAAINWNVYGGEQKEKEAPLIGFTGNWRSNSLLKRENEIKALNY